MLTRRTVFVLGAGAHAPYGFSTGHGLLENARRHHVDSIPDLTSNRVRPNEARVLHEAIQTTFERSIDAMLEHRHDIALAGKRVMAALLLQEERTAARAFYAPALDWMAIVFNAMARGARSVKECGANPISFLTFNYDRSLEHRLLNGLASKYGIRIEECWPILDQIPVVHLYGSMGPLFLLRRDGQIHAIPFGAPEDRDVTFLGLAMGNVEHTIKIAHDVDANPEEFQRAHRLLQEAEIVFFLGFAFAPANVERLQLDEISPQTVVCCSTYGMRQAEINQRIIPSFQPGTRNLLRYSHEELSILLRDSVDLFE
jgi:hypothetical protein